MNVLYVGSDFNEEDAMCPGSTVCLALAEKIPDEALSIQNCDILRKTTIEFPDWLNGTPILINEEEGIPYRGTDAVRKMREVVKEHEKSANSEHSRKKNSSSDQSRDREPQKGQGQKAQKAQKAQDSPAQSLDDHFTMEVSPQTETRTDKVTEQDLQKYMEMRNASPASAQPQQAAT